MDRITALKARRAGYIEQMEALVASVDDEAGMTAEQQAEFDRLKAADDKAAADLAAAEDIERRKAAMARPAAPLPMPAPAASVPAQPAEKGLRFARMTRALAAGGGIPYVAAQIAESWGDSGLFASQNMGSGAAGGFLVPEDVSAEIIELLRPQSVIMRGGPIVVPMPNGNLTMNRQATGASFAYIGEQQDIGATGISVGQVKLSAKKLTGIVPVSNDLLRSASVAVDRLLRDDIVADAAQVTDRFFLRGPGTDFAPLGLRWQHIGTPFAATHVLTANGTVNLGNVTNDLGRMELALANANVDFTAAHWVMSPRSAMYLMNARDANGNIAFPEMAGGQLRRKPYHVTTEIPDNLSGSQSEILLVAPQHVLVGEHLGINIAMSTEAAYRDAANNLQAAFSRDETLMRMILMHDIGLRHLPAVAVLTAVTWAS